MPLRSWVAAAILAIVLSLLGRSSVLRAESVSPYSAWANGPSKDPNYFPVSVWLQDPSTAVNWKNAGVNLFIGLWQGPTTAQLNALRAAGMQAIVSRNSIAPTAAGMTLPDGRPLVVGWLQEDEPDNHPKTPVSTIQNIYQGIKAFDVTRPVYLNLSQGLGWDNGTWPGQGGNIVPNVDYPGYLAGTDIGSMDLYPMDCDRVETCGDAWRPALGVDRLYQYGGPNKLVWNYIETGDVDADGRKATVDEIKMEVWSSIIHGSKGITYFIHGKSNVSNFNDKALLRPENAGHLAGVTAINLELQSLAPVINAATINGVATVQVSNPQAIVDQLLKQFDGASYLFASGMRDFETTANFSLAGWTDAVVDVIGEDRQVQMTGGMFSDVFDGFDVHLYRISPVMPVLPGDYSGNGVIDAADYVVWRDGLGQTGVGLRADGNGDQVVDDGDYNIWKANYGMDVGAESTHIAVIEPSTAGLLTMALIHTLFNQRSKATYYNSRDNVDAT